MNVNLGEILRQLCRKRCGLDVLRGLLKVGWDVKKFRDVRGFGVLFVFWGIWKGIRNRKGCDCVWGFGVFGQRIRKGRGC